MSLKKITIIFLAIVLIIVFGWISIISPIIPISYDEAWNWTNVASKGHLFPIFNYPAANNHVFFSFLQSFVTPKFLLWYLPEITRLLNVFVDAFFILFVWYLFSKFFKKSSPLWLACIFLIIVFTSPLSMPFFIIARGYLLGALLLLMGIYLLSSRKYFLTSLMFILSCWTLPTYSYCLPLIYLYALFSSNKKERIRLYLSILVVPITLFILYSPIMSGVLVQGKIWHTGTYAQFISAIWTAFSNLYNISPFIFINDFYFMSYIVSIAVLMRKNTDTATKRFFTLLTFSILSYIIVVGIFSWLGIATPPFLRVSLFIPLFGAITIFFASIVVKQHGLKVFLVLMLLLNTSVGFYFFITKLPFQRKNPYPILVDYLVPLDFPISSKERILLQQGKISELDLTFGLDDSVLYYFSQIYHVPVVNKLKK